MTNDDINVAKQKFDNLSEYSIKLSKWYLKPLGAWPASSSTTKIERITSQILIVICWCIILFTLIPGILYILFVKQDIYVKLKIFGPLSHWCVDAFNYAILLLRKNDILHCIEHLRADWKLITRTQDQQVMLRNAKIGRYIAAFCAIFMQIVIFFTCFILGMFKRSIHVDNRTVELYNLPCPAYKIPFDTDPTIHDIMLGTQFLSAFVVSSSASASFTLATIFTCHVVGQLNIMVIWVNEFVDRLQKENKDNHINKISVIVEHHLRILSLIARIERITCPIYFMELFKCMMGMCMPSYYFLAEWSEHNIQNLTIYVMVALSMSFNILLVCCIGEILKEQCKKVGDMVYMTNWYQLPGKDILNLIMIISRSSMEVKITAGKIITMSIYTFGNIVKTVFAYLNMLRQITMM
ncbi:uncharacterized protein LOC100869376 isoform X2 [Apis florea]|uniref:uncharacterized protein LOC100869376 isoform X2 n=1 Tax=Apis florea TaxID=7463 RepID=UPI000252AD20|nr:uncharacterized protein LOC100869376 isoform X2 [Apis florea]